MKEIWKDIAGYEGLYQISNFGKVKSFRPWNRASGEKERILKPTINANGYEQVTLYRSQTDRHKFLVHRLVAQAFIENPEHLDAVNHKDENPGLYGPWRSTCCTCSSDGGICDKGRGERTGG